MRARFNETTMEFQIRTGKPSSQIFARARALKVLNYLDTHVHPHQLLKSCTQQVGCTPLIFHYSYSISTWFATLVQQSRREMEPKCVPQLFLKPLRGTRRSDKGDFFPCPQLQSHKSLQKLTRPRFLLAFKMAN